MVFSEARRCSWPSRSWIVARRGHLPYYDYSSSSGGRLWLDLAYLCFPNIGTARLRKSKCALSDSPNTAPIQRDGFRTSSVDAELCAFNSSSLFLLLLVKPCLSPLNQLI